MPEIGVRDREVIGEHPHPSGLRSERRERRGPDKSGGVRRKNRHDVGSGVDQTTAQLDGFVGGDPAADAEHNGRAGK